MTAYPLPEFRSLPSKAFEGVFELHLTADAANPGDQARFGEACRRLGVKPVLIEAPGAALTLQPMTSSYHRGTLGQVLDVAASLSGQLGREGFPVVRCKIEATMAARGVPDEDAAALADPPGRYFEFHTRVALPSGADLAPLRALCEARGGRLSSNAFRTRPDGLQERFVTVRAHRVGRATALGHFRALLAALRAGGLSPGHLLHEYVVIDTNSLLDRGWLALISRRPRASHALPLTRGDATPTSARVFV